MPSAGENCSEDVRECASSPCLHGSTCSEPLVNGYQCTCPHGVHGNQCQHVTLAMFDGNDVVTLPPLISSGEENSPKRRKRRSFNNDSIVSESHEGFILKHTTRPKRSTVTNDSLEIQLYFATTVLDGILLVASGVRIILLE